MGLKVRELECMQKLRTTMGQLGRRQSQGDINTHAIRRIENLKLNFSACNTYSVPL